MLGFRIAPRRVRKQSDSRGRLNVRLPEQGQMSRVFSALLGSVVLMMSGLVLAQTQDDEYVGWEELRNDPPEWFKDAKFGIYFHWGVYSVPAHHSEWYSRNMYNPDTSIYEHHVSTYGPLNEFGYKDFVPLFKAENFDADEWVDLFVRAGARFAGPVAEHADGFSMWDSKVNSWNAVDRGPGIDVVGEMERAVHKRGLKFITTFHHQWLWGWYPTFKSAQDVDAGDPAYSELYGPVVNEDTWRHRKLAMKPDDEFNQRFTDKVLEVIHGYSPDMIYFDSRFGHIGAEYRKTIVREFLASMKNRGKDGEGVILYKHQDLPEYSGVLNLEKARMNEIRERVWQTEEPISTFAWNYYEEMELRPAEDVLHSLVDIVSKNGVYLLNIGPKADGTIPDEQQEILLALGEWLQRNGEAIYGTRPWYTYGEGPRKEAEQAGEESDLKYFELKYSPEDVRYTTKDESIYAILMGRPAEAQNVLLESFAKSRLPSAIDITDVTILGTGREVDWDYRNDGLSIAMPASLPETMALVLKIETNPSTRLH